MKFAVCVVLDQTIGYVSESGDLTTRHPEAQLFDTRLEANNARREHNATIRSDLSDDLKERCKAWVIVVPDEVTFGCKRTPGDALQAKRIQNVARTRSKNRQT